MCATLMLGACQDGSPDVIFHGGPVLTVNARDDVAQALAMRDGIITAVGSERDVLATKGATRMRTPSSG